MSGYNAESGLAELRAMQQVFESGPLVRATAQGLESWQPLNRSLWRYLQPFMTLQSGQTGRCRRIDGHDIHYWEGGNPEGPTLVLLHGFGACKENWAFLAPRLASRFHLLMPDLPGFGLSSFVSTADYSLAAQADRLAQWLIALGRDNVFVTGSSMGGAIAALLAARHPGLVAAVCLMNAAGAPALHMSMLESGIAVGRNYLVPARRSEVAQVFGICLHRRQRALGAFLALAMAGEMAHRLPLNQYLFSCMVASLGEVWQSLPAIRQPTLILWGDSDRVLDVTCGDALAGQLDNARMMVLPQVGHLPMLEEPRTTGQVMADFWLSHHSGIAATPADALQI